MRRSLSLLLLALSLAPLPGCAGLVRSWDVAPSGLQRSEEELRLALRGGQIDSAFVERTLNGKRAPSDDLLRTLYGGITAYYAGRYDESGALLDAASLLADERATKSVSRSAFSLVTNDLALPYETSRTERLMIPYYGALAYLRRNDVEGAAVEARRLAALLEQYQGDVAPESARLHAALRYFAGAIFEAYGDRNDAAVSYRNAAALAALDTAPPSIPADSGDVVVLIEQGFVAHRAAESLNVLLGDDEVHGLREGEPRNRLDVAGLVAARIMESATANGGLASGPLRVGGPPRGVAYGAGQPRCEETDPRDGPSIVEVLRPAGDSTRPPVRTVVDRRPQRRCREDEDDDAPYLLHVAWPTLRWSSRAPQSAGIFFGSDTAAARPLGSAVFADVSEAAARDFRAELPGIISRTVVRNAAKAALTKGAKDKAEKKDEGLGTLVGLLGNVGNALLERADTRCWHLLPGGLGIARLRLPPGQHELRVMLPDGNVLQLHQVQVRGGRVAIVSGRVY